MRPQKSTGYTAASGGRHSSEKEAHPLCVLSHIWGSTPDDAGARIISIHMRKFPIGILQLRVENIIIKVLRLQSADIHDPAYIHIHIL